MEEKIQTLEERLVYSETQNRWLELHFDRVRFPDGSEGCYNRAVENHGRPGVAIIPLRGDHIGLVHQYRYPVGRHMWEILRGFGETNDPREDAVRELREETGIDVRTEELIDLGVIYPNSGLLASEVHLYAARIEAVLATPLSTGFERNIRNNSCAATVAVSSRPETCFVS